MNPGHVPKVMFPVDVVETVIKILVAGQSRKIKWTGIDGGYRSRHT